MPRIEFWWSWVDEDKKAHRGLLGSVHVAESVARNKDAVEILKKSFEDKVRCLDCKNPIYNGLGHTVYCKASGKVNG